MSNELTMFIFGVLMSIPIGIGVNLLTPVIQRRMEGRPRLPRSVEKLVQELGMVHDLYENRPKLYLMTASTALSAFVLFCLASVAWALPGYYVGEHFLPSIEGISDYLEIGELIDFAASLAAIVFFLFAIIVCINHIRLLAKVRDFESLRKEVVILASELNVKMPPDLLSEK